jgi:hypothetical protein
LSGGWVRGPLAPEGFLAELQKELEDVVIGIHGCLQAGGLGGEYLVRSEANTGLFDRGCGEEASRHPAQQGTGAANSQQKVCRCQRENFGNGRRRLCLQNWPPPIVV